MLSMMISSTKQPGSDIDVYLSTLIEYIKLLWYHGVEVFYGFANEIFKVHAMLFCIINGFSAYRIMSRVIKHVQFCIITGFSAY